MSKANKKTKAKKADDGQRNNGRAISNLERKVALLENRTITKRGVSGRENEFQRKAEVQGILGRPGPVVAASKDLAAHLLTPEEKVWDDYLRAPPTGTGPPPLVNYNVEPSRVQQHLSQYYDANVQVAGNGATTMVITPCTRSSLESHNTPNDYSNPHSFYTTYLTGVNGVPPALVVPGPADTAGGLGKPVVYGHIASNNVFLMTTTASTTPAGFMSSLIAAPACPFTAVDDDPDVLRWQLKKIHVQVENTTVGASRGGEAVVFQPRNNMNDVAATTLAYRDAETRGFYRSYEDMQVGASDGRREGRWVTLDVRPTHQAYHCVHTSTASNQNSLRSASTFLGFNNTTATVQNLKVRVVLDWSLAGSSVRGIGHPNVACPLAAAHAKMVSENMRSAGILPSDQHPKQSIAAGTKLLTSTPHQAMLGGVLSSVMHGEASSHPVVKAAKQLLGQHARTLAAAGFAAAKHLASLVSGA